MDPVEQEGDLKDMGDWGVPHLTKEDQEQAIEAAVRRVLEEFVPTTQRSKTRGPDALASTQGGRAGSSQDMPQQAPEKTTTTATKVR